MVLVTFQPLLPKAVSENCGGKPHPQREKPLSALGMKNAVWSEGHIFPDIRARLETVPVPKCERKHGNHGTLVSSLAKLVS